MIQYLYDGVPWFPSTNALGRLVEMTNGVNDASFFYYDSMGHLAAQNSWTTSSPSSTANPVSATYDLTGDLTSLTYPDGEKVTYTPDAAGRMTSAIDTANAINYVTGATYGSDGALAGFLNGNTGSFAGINNVFNYNKRLQPINMSASAPGQTVFSIGYDFHIGNGTTGSNNGNVWGITNYKDNTRNQSFTYDQLNRLTSAQNAGTNCAITTVNGKTEYWGNNYGYDAWGNLLAKTVTKCSAENLSLTALTNNRLSGYTYDAAGNMTVDPTDGVTAVYDAENRPATATKNGATATYTYDADGERVRKDVTGVPSTEYIYFGGQVIAEKNVSTAAWTNYVSFNGQRVARRDSTGVFYYFSDHLKTTDIVTDAQGNIKNESDFYPWGGELQFLANDSNHYKFTGKERDAESGLDYFGARYYSNGLGRFISADWSATPIPVPYADFGDPQTLNLYGYVGGNPASKADPDGHNPGVLALPPVAVVAALATAAVVAIVLSDPNVQKAAAQAMHDLTGSLGKTLVGIGINPFPSHAPSQPTVPPPSVPNTNADTQTPASTSNAGTVSTSTASSTTNTGTIYVVPGTGTKSGRPYVGRHNKPNPAKTRRSNDGRDRSQAKVVDKYPANDPQAGREAEQQQIDKKGGVEKLDNMRNEIAKPK